MNTKDYVIATIEYIEQHLLEEVSLDQLADQFHYSKFHYARLMKAALGETIKEYQMKRRLTVAAMSLLEENYSILHIAIMCGYYSQESFGRMFKAYFGVTPKRYRDRKIHYFNLYKYALKPEEVHRLMSYAVSVDYQIHHKNSFEITGLLYHGNNKNHEIARVYNEAALKLNFETIYHQIDGFYGVDFSCGEEKGTTDFDFIAGVDSRYLSQMKRTDAQFVHKTIPENDYAVFSLTHEIEKIPFQIQKSWLSLLQDERYCPYSNYGYEFYPNGFIPNQKGRNGSLFIPIREQDGSKKSPHGLL